MIRRAMFLLSFLAVTAATLSAQPASAPWRTLETEHFRIHFPAPFEDWAGLAAGKLEKIRKEVIAAVGYEPREKVDVLVMDPAADANGSAWPLLGNPRMVLWTSPPGPDTLIGNYGNWIDLVAIHEETHLVHLLRPSRNTLRRIYERLLPLGQITLEAPRWVTEGYATVIEGRLTGRGRPNSAFRAAVLRKWAEEGRLPTYEQMASDSRSFLGMSMAYLVGSSYLEWLEERTGEKSLAKVWARMTARQSRSFEQAFEGVYGDSPRKLYDRFRAELIWRALTVERLRDGKLREGELWQDFSWSTEAPEISPDGERLLTVIRGRDEPPRIAVFSTSPDTEREKEYQEKISRMLRRDPEDVRPVTAKPIPLEPLHELVSRDKRNFRSPRWLDDRSVLYQQFLPDGDGVLHPQLFVWTPASGRVESLEIGRELREADPSPDGRFVVAVRNQFGKSQLVRLDLSSGEEVPLTEPSLEAIYSSPRVSPDGSLVAYAIHRGKGWDLAVMELATRSERNLDVPANTMVADPAWSSDGRSLYASVGSDAFIDIFRFSLDGGDPVQISRVPGAAFGAAPTPDGSLLYFLSMDSDGFDIRRLSLESVEPLGSIELPAEVSPLASLPRPPERELVAAEAVGGARPYGLGRQEFSILEGGNAAPAARNVELGVRIGDVVGRLDTLLVGSFFGDRGPHGGAIASAWRGWPVALSLHAFAADEDFSSAIRARDLPTEARGVELGVSWSRDLRNSDVGLFGGAIGQRLETDSSNRFDSQMVFVGGSTSGALPRFPWSVPYQAELEVDGGRTDGQSWTRAKGWFEAGIDYDGNAIRTGWGRGTSSSIERNADRFLLGGVSSTIIPEGAWANRILMPALESGSLIGDEFERQSATLTLKAIPLEPFYSRYRLWSDGATKGDWLSLAGLQLSFETDPFPLLQLPAARILLGVARILDEPLKDRTRWWLGVTFRP